MNIRIFFLFFVLTVASCSAPMKVSSNIDKSVDFSKYKTFNFYEITEEHLPIKEVNRRRLAMAIEVELGYKGIKKISENPDILVNLYSAIYRREAMSSGNQSNVGYYGAASPYGTGVGISVSPKARASTYTTGTVVFDLVDRVENKLVLEGIATINATDNHDADRIINYTVKYVFKDIPDKMRR